MIHMGYIALVLPDWTVAEVAFASHRPLDWLRRCSPDSTRTIAVSLITELKRRNVFKVSAAYLALSWAVIEISGTVFPVLHLPEWTLSLLVWLALIGFPFVAVFAWVFELTPDGLKRSQEVDRSESISTRTSRRLDYIIIAMLGVVTVMFALDRFYQREGETEVTAERVASQAAEPSTPAVVNEPDATQRAESVPAPIEKSIAVLPFVNMSSDKEQEYFSDGMSEELLNQLAKIPQLKVAARTSSFSFKGKDIAIREIARQLNVAHVLEGSVRKSGVKVRITAQLIRAVDGYHLWSAAWDRELADVFAVQDEIAGNVVKELKVAMLGAMVRAKVVDVDAHNLLLRARHSFLLASPESYARALKLYRDALKIDPEYTAAWVGVASTLSYSANDGLGSFEKSYAEAREVTVRALSIEPDYAPAIAQLGRIAMWYEGDFRTAAREFERALAIAPDDSDILYNAARLMVAMGRFESAQELGKYLVQRDPLNSFSYYALALAYHYAGRPEEALSFAQTFRELAPGSAQGDEILGEMLLVNGAARESLAEMKQEQSEIFRLLGLSMAYHALGQESESNAALVDLKVKYAGVSPASVATVHAYRGEADAAFEWLERAARQPDTGMLDIAVEPMLSRVHGDSRWLPFLRSIGRSPEHLASIKFDVKLPE